MKQKILILILLIAFVGVIAVAQKTITNKKSTMPMKPVDEVPTARQIDFISRLHNAMVDPTESGDAFIYSAYKVDGTKEHLEIRDRRLKGLSNSRNLPAIVSFAKRVYGSLASAALNGSFGIINTEECEYLCSLSDNELKATAEKYSRWIVKAIDNWNNQPQY